MLYKRGSDREPCSSASEHNQHCTAGQLRKDARVPACSSEHLATRPTTSQASAGHTSLPSGPDQSTAPPGTRLQF